MSTSQTNANGRTERKNLASQLDRLDAILDVLGEGISETVADAVKQAAALAVQQAVETVLREVLARPELLRAFVPQPQATPAPAQSSEPARLEGLCAKVRRGLGVGWRWLREKDRRPFCLSVAVGLAAGVFGLLAGPVMSAVALGACGATLTVMASLGAPLLSCWKPLKSPAQSQTP